MRKILINQMLIIAVITIFGTTAFAQGRPKTGGYKAAKTDDARVVAAAEFAVAERSEKNSEQEGLTLDSVDKAETQVVAGTNFRLCLTVRLEDETQQIETIVFQSLKQEYQLKSWTVKDCAEKESAASDANPATMQNVDYKSAQAKMPVCKDEQLSLSETEGEADMGGKRYAKFLLTNISEAACALTGYPTISLLDGKGQPMSSVKVVYNDWRFNGGEVSNSPPTAALEPRKTAWFQIFYTDGMISANLKKPAPASAHVKVNAPKSKTDLVVNSALHAYKQIEVSYVREGAPD